nr:MAG TPA: hypothetical protein [Caudoviricetes sp.]
MILAISLVCGFIAKYIPNEYARINGRINNLLDNQQMIYKYHLISLLTQMRNLRLLAMIHKEYETVSSIQKNIEEIKKLLELYE